MALPTMTRAAVRKREKAVITLMAEAVRQGRAAPTYAEIGQAIGTRETTAWKIIDRLRGRGAISISGFGMHRVVTVPGVGSTWGATQAIRNMVVDAADIWGVPSSAIYGPSRFQTITRPRFAVYRVSNEIGFSYGRIGDTLARDHTSVIYGAGKAAVYEAECPDFAARIAELRELYADAGVGR